MTLDLTKGPVAGNLRRQATPFALGLIVIFVFLPLAFAGRWLSG